jgi:hypothetical protein
MTHEEFVAAHRAGKLAAQIDPKAAAQLVSRQMMLPLFLLPVFGIAVALALAGYFIAGALLFVAALVFRYAVRRSSRGFILTRSLADPRFYEQAVAAGILVVDAFRN